MTELILVDENDFPVGKMEKMEAHEKGLLHRAFSVFIYNKKGEMLLQQRASNKYHSPNLWSNACCSHPMPGEDTIDAAHRRLQEELGFDTELTPLFQFIYKKEFDNGLTEYEYDHVFVGTYDGTIHPNPVEVKDYCFKNPIAIKENLEQYEHKYSYWFNVAFNILEDHYQESHLVHQ